MPQDGAEIEQATHLHNAELPFNLEKILEKSQSGNTLPDSIFSNSAHFRRVPQKIGKNTEKFNWQLTKNLVKLAVT